VIGLQCETVALIQLASPGVVGLGIDTDGDDVMATGPAQRILHQSAGVASALGGREDGEALDERARLGNTGHDVGNRLIVVVNDPQSNGAGGGQRIRDGIGIEMPEPAERRTIDGRDHVIGVTPVAAGRHGPSESRSWFRVAETQEVEVLRYLTASLEERPLIVGSKGLGDGVLDTSFTALRQRMGDQFGTGGISAGH
jgi:hypothetical protein